MFLIGTKLIPDDISLLNISLVKFWVFLKISKTFN